MFFGAARNPRRRCRGVMVEAVIVAPVLGLLLIGLVQFCIYFSDSLHLKYAAYEASRYAYGVGSDGAVDVGNRLAEVMPGARLVSDNPVIVYPHPRWGDLNICVVDVEYASEAMMKGIGSSTASDETPSAIYDGLVLRAKGFFAGIAGTE
jgi:hypothetical protein